MASSLVSHCDFYVYVLFREDGSTPFYIGMGRNGRWLQHEKTAHRKNSHKNNIICDMRARGIEIPKAKLFERLSKEHAVQIEEDLIFLIGRAPNGPLANISAGREGILGLTKECLTARAQKIANALQRPDVRAALSAKSKGRKLGPRSEETKAKLRAACTGFKHTPEAIAKISARSRKMTLTPERKEALRQSRIGRSHTLEARQKMSDARKGKKRSQEAIEKTRQKMTGRKLSPEHVEKLRQRRMPLEARKRIAAALCGRIRPEETKRKLSEASKKIWQAKRSAANRWNGQFEFHC